MTDSECTSLLQPFFRLCGLCFLIYRNFISDPLSQCIIQLNSFVCSAEQLLKQRKLISFSFNRKNKTFGRLNRRRLYVIVRRCFTARSLSQNVLSKRNLHTNKGNKSSTNNIKRIFFRILFNTTDESKCRSENSVVIHFSHSIRQSAARNFSSLSSSSLVAAAAAAATATLQLRTTRIFRIFRWLLTFSCTHIS